MPRKRTGRPAIVYTQERIAILTRDYPAGVDIYEIKQRLNECPGPTILYVLNIAVAANRLFALKRPPNYRSTVWDHKRSAA